MESKIKFDLITPISYPGEGSAGATGSWRVFKPIIDREKCRKCLLCWLYCPEAAIRVSEENYPEIIYEYCKGCGICANECPVKAISMVEE
ncbi:MAG: ferredoxin [Thermoprotei archaeon]|nr:MAG: ferredoxin [Thermoprotei archaeon]RLE99953.1 MAG: ferredoxin [Thermoprotei archaeon]HDI74458.1 4Fe-4S dicluster domain-containing protein [Thermoprotei archaeon]